MPTYGYRCGNCGHQFEIVQRISAEPLTTCPKCQGKLSKVLYPVGISFKGSGFYTTDYKGAGNSSAGSSNGSAAGSEGSGDSKSEAKPESNTKTESKKSDTKTESKSDTKTEKSS
jgi:putative FmdB family regulatory protein